MNQVVIHDAIARKWLRFTQPQQVITTRQLAEVLPQLEQINELVRQKKLYAVGFISYEAAGGFDDILATHEADSFPLLWFGLYKQPEEISLPAPSQDRDYSLNWQPTVTEEEYNKAIALIKNYISRGDTYQVNYTMRLRSQFQQNPWQYFLHLTQAQQANYSAYLNLPDFAICSASPELFFSWDGGKIVTRPMKGTSARGYTLQSDRIAAGWLQNSTKNQAENVMIVDMIRNDLARVAKLNTVRVPSLFDVEQYPTLWQMTSTVTAETNATLPEIMTALFPCASITGAPKPRTMEIIRQLEPTPRKIYTGTIGMLTPDSKAQFNVAIRTVLIDKQSNIAEYGVGGGIVWDSASASEYEECQIKARVLLNKNQKFDLLETLLWTPSEGYFLLDYHLKRLRSSAEYFKYPVDIDKIEQELLTASNSLKDTFYKVRAIISKAGKIQIETIPFTPNNPNIPVKLGIAKDAIDIRNPFLYHKTTNRDIYNQIRHKNPNCDDVILLNERREITETCIYNIVIQRAGKLLTPPVKSGLLAGTFRQYLLEQHKIEEAIIKLGDLQHCDAIYLINSVRKWQKGILMLNTKI